MPDEPAGPVVTDEAQGGAPQPEGGQESAAAAQTPPETAVKEFLDDSGAFVGDWQTNLVPEDFRGRQVYEVVTDLKSLMKQLGHQDAVIKRQGKGVTKPTDDATPTEWDEYYKALGRPDTPDGYDPELPEGLEYDEQRLAGAKEAFHKAGLTPTQAQAVIDLDAQRAREDLDQAKADNEVARQEAEKTLRGKWGEAYDERLAMANRMIAENTDGETRDEVLGAIKNDPHVADFLANIAKKFMEGGVIQGEAPPTPTPQEAQNQMEEKIVELNQDPEMKSTNPAKYKRLNEEINTLARQAEAADKAGKGT